MRRNRVKRERVTIQVASKTKDNAGQFTKSWSAVSGMSDLPAHVEFLKGTESYRGRRVEADVLAVFEMRQRNGITTLHRLVHKGVTYGITSVMPVEGRYEGGFRDIWIFVRADANA